MGEAMVRFALALARKGLAVLPCWPRGKLPITKHGCKDASTDPAKIESWWNYNPTANIAVATGAISSIFVLDVDGLDAETALAKLEAEHGALPATVEAITARGRHIYFKMPAADVRNSASRIAAGIDVRGDGGYVLAPPSMHPSGRHYAWSVDSAGAFAAAPIWLLQMIATPAVTATNAMPRVTPSSEWQQLIEGATNEGARNDTLTRITGHLLRQYVNPYLTLALVQTWNTARCVPPLPESEVKRIVNSVASIEQHRRERANG
jgi:hypothetical protein